MTQQWRSLTFIHWAYNAAAIQRLLPSGLTVDTFEGRAWVGLVPFLLSRIRPYGTPAIPWISQFPETNVRTYVRGPDNKIGVWFFTLEADRLLGVLGARWLYHLPYRWARMSLEEQSGAVRYRSERLPPFGRGSTDIEVQPQQAIETDEFAHYLTARFRLYAAAGSRLWTADIEHEPWLLRRARLLRLHEDLVENSGVPKPSGKPVVHFSEGVDVRVDRIRRLR